MHSKNDAKVDILHDTYILDMIYFMRWYIRNDYFVMSKFECRKRSRLEYYGFEDGYLDLYRGSLKYWPAQHRLFKPKKAKKYSFPVWVEIWYFRESNNCVFDKQGRPPFFSVSQIPNTKKAVNTPNERAFFDLRSVGIYDRVSWPTGAPRKRRFLGQNTFTPQDAPW